MKKLFLILIFFLISLQFIMSKDTQMQVLSTYSLQYPEKVYEDTQYVYFLTGGRSSSMIHRVDKTTLAIKSASWKNRERFDMLFDTGFSVWENYGEVRIYSKDISVYANPVTGPSLGVSAFEVELIENAKDKRTKIGKIGIGNGMVALSADGANVLLDREDGTTILNLKTLKEHAVIEPGKGMKTRIAGFIGNGHVFNVYNNRLHIYDFNGKEVYSELLLIGNRGLESIFFFDSYNKAYVNDRYFVDLRSIRKAMVEKGILIEERKGNALNSYELYFRADNKSDITGKLKKGESFVVLDKSRLKDRRVIHETYDTEEYTRDYWYKIRIENKAEGWAYGEYVVFDGKKSVEKGVVDRNIVAFVKDIEYTSFTNENQKKLQHHPIMILDGNEKTQWFENVVGPGENEFIEIIFKDKIKIDSIVIKNGVFQKESYWKLFNRVENIEISSKNTKMIKKLQNKRIIQKIEIKEIYNNIIKLTIKSVYMGSLTENNGTAITDIEFYYKNKKIQIDLTDYLERLKKEGYE